MRQHVNPLSNNFDKFEKIISLKEMFNDSELNLHLDIGCATGEFLFNLALVNTNWNYLGIEIRERLVKTAKVKLRESKIENLYFVFGNANKILSDVQSQFILNNLKSISFNFPDPWFKKRHYKRRVIQSDFINTLSISIKKGAFIFIKTDVEELFKYMDFTLSSNLNLKKIDKNDFNYATSFNPNRIKTNREKYVINNEFDIFERIYMKI